MMSLVHFIPLACRINKKSSLQDKTDSLSEKHKALLALANTGSLSEKEEKLLSLANMGYTVEEASTAMDRCGAYTVLLNLLVFGLSSSHLVMH